jgi:methylglutaconyl-CoA hydratase
MSTILKTVEDDVLHISLNRPEVRNAFNAEMIAEVTESFSSISLRAVVLSGEGKAFCAGGDLEWMRSSIDYTEEQNLADARRLAEMFTAIDTCPCPVIGKVHGAAFGGGLGLLCVCDVVVAAEETKFCFSEVKLGLAPAVISSFAIAKIGPGQARRYFITSEVFGPEIAKDLGLVHEIASVDALDSAVADLLSAVRQGGPNAVEEAKRLIHAIAEKPQDALDLSAASIAKLRVSAEGQEGVRAFLEKRKPAWTSGG